MLSALSNTGPPDVGFWRIGLQAGFKAPYPFPRPDGGREDKGSAFYSLHPSDLLHGTGLGLPFEAQSSRNQNLSKGFLNPRTQAGTSLYGRSCAGLEMVLMIPW